MHFLFERAGFNRWSPAMAGRNQGRCFCKYLMQAAESIQVKGESLSNRLYVPEASETAKAEQAERRRARLSVQPHDGRQPLAVVLGESQGWESAPAGARIWIRHMPDAPLLADARTWALFQHWLRAARGARLGRRARVAPHAGGADPGAPGARIRDRPRQPDADQRGVDSAGGVHEAPLVRALVSQGRRFVKPLRYDARRWPGSRMPSCWTWARRRSTSMSSAASG